MNARSSRLTVGTWVMLLLALTWGGAVLAVRHYRPVAAPAERVETMALRQELASLPMNATQRSQEAKSPAGSIETSLDALVNEGWRVAGSDGSRRLEAIDPAALRWPDIVRTAERLEQVGAIASLRIETTGSRSLRSFSRIEIGLRDSLSPANPVRAQSVGPGSGPGAAGLRETGPGTLSADRAPPPAAAPGAGSVSRPGGAPGPATLAPAAGSAQRNLNPQKHGDPHPPDP